MNKEVINIYTDGACKGNPGTGGLGIIIDYKGYRKEWRFKFDNTTNNQMELLAVIIALQQLTRLDIPIVVQSGNGGKAKITFPIKPGDTVLVVFSERDPSNFLSGNNGDNSGNSGNNGQNSGDGNNGGNQ